MSLSEQFLILGRLRGKREPHSQGSRNFFGGQPVTVSICLILTLISTGCDSDSPTQNKAEVPNYRVWFDHGGAEFTGFVYHTATEDFDTVTFPFNSSDGVTVSHDGKTLYLSHRTVCGVVNAADLSVVTTLNYTCNTGTVVSPDGQYVVLLGDTVTLLSTSDYSVLYIDSLRSPRAVFSRNDAFAYFSTGRVIRRLDFETWQMDTVVQFDAPVADFDISRDEKLIFANTILSSHLDVFYVYDVSEDLVVHTKTFSPGKINIGVLEDGQHVVLCEGATIGSVPGPRNEFYIMDTKNNFDMRSISTNGLYISMGRDTVDIFPVGFIQLIPDGKSIMLLTAIHAWGFTMYDLEKGEFTDTVTFNDVSLRRFGCKLMK